MTKECQPDGEAISSGDLYSAEAIWKSPFLARSTCRKDSPCAASRSSSFFVQSQSQHAHASVPFSCRQLRRECPSFTLSNWKYSSHYRHSSPSGGEPQPVAHLRPQ